MVIFQLQKSFIMKQKRFGGFILFSSFFLKSPHENSMTGTDDKNPGKATVSIA